MFRSPKPDTTPPRLPRTLPPATCDTWVIYKGLGPFRIDLIPASDKGKKKRWLF